MYIRSRFVTQNTEERNLYIEIVNEFRDDMNEKLEEILAGGW